VFLMFIKLLNLLNPTDLMTRISNFFNLFRNPNVALTLFFLHLKTFGLAHDVALTIDIHLLKATFFLFFFFAFSLWYFFIIIDFFFDVGFTILSQYHTPNHEYHKLTIVDPNRSNVLPSQYFVFEKKWHSLCYHLSILKVFLIIIHQDFDFLMS
jgi:hypothetical protein